MEEELHLPCEKFDLRDILGPLRTIAWNVSVQGDLLLLAVAPEHFPEGDSVIRPFVPATFLQIGQDRIERTELNRAPSLCAVDAAKGDRQFDDGAVFVRVDPTGGPSEAICSLAECRRIAVGETRMLSWDSGFDMETMTWSPFFILQDREDRFAEAGPRGEASGTDGRRVMADASGQFVVARGSRLHVLENQGTLWYCCDADELAEQ